MTRDIAQLPESDKTLIHKNDNILTYQQRVKINLARAVYKKADVYLLDDPLTPLEPPTRNYIFKQCIQIFLNGKSIILTTRPTQLFEPVDFIVFLNFDKTTWSNSYNQLGKKSKKFKNIMKKCKPLKNDDNYFDYLNFDIIPTSIDEEITAPTIENTNNLNFMMINNCNYLMYYFKKYFIKSKSILMTIWIFLMFIIAQIFITGSELAIGYWIDWENLKFIFNNKTYDNFIEKKILSIIQISNDDKWLSSITAFEYFTFFIITSIIIICLRNFFFIRVNIKHSISLYKSSIKKLLNTQLSFFKKIYASNYNDKIIKRFADDLSYLDQELPKYLLQIFHKVVLIISIFLIVIFISVWMILPVAIVSLSFIVAFYFYLKTSRSVKAVTSHSKFFSS